jgi:hypothetical protein
VKLNVFAPAKLMAVGKGCRKINNVLLKKIMALRDARSAELHYPDINVFNLG